MHEATMHRPRIVSIDSVKRESPTIKSFIFNDRFCASAKPGQFSMIWVPGFDEIPMSLTVDPETHSPMIVVKRVGEATEALHQLSQNELIGVRGPYGTHFRIGKARRILIAAGGAGIVPTLRIALESKRKGYDCDVVLGAKDAEEILFLKAIESAGCGVYPVTEDGSLGVRGLIRDVVNKKLTSDYDLVICCGPELMIQSILKLATERNVPVQISLERIMKCGVGICGSCELSGFRVCKEGPVFCLEDLILMKNTLGQFKRDSSGKKVRFEY